MKEKNIRKAKVIKKDNNFPTYVNCLCGLNDGRLAIGGNNSLMIYNMKTYKFDLYLDNQFDIKSIIELSNYRLFYFTYFTESEGPWVDEIIEDQLVEISNNKYKDLTDTLPLYPRNYNILYEYSETIFITGRYYKEQNNQIEEKIDKLMKINNKYRVISRLKLTGLVNFVLLKNNLMAVLIKIKKDKDKYNDNAENYCLNFYDVRIFKFIKRQNVEKTEIICPLDEKFMFIGTHKGVIIYDYINFKNNKTISCQYPLYKIYLFNGFVYIGETENYDYKLKTCKNRIVEYEYDYKGNLKQIYSYYKPQNRLKDFIKVKDGRLLTCSEENVKIWK